MSATKIIKAFAKKSLTKDKGSGITSLPSEFMASEKAAQIEFLLSRAGIPLEQLDDYIRSEADLLKFLNIIEAINKPKVYSGQAAADQLNKLFPKKGEVVKFPQKRSFAEEIEAMKKSGDIVDEDKMVISEKITDREMFKDAGKRFNKTDIVADSVARITSMEPVAAMKEANKIIKREGIYKNLNKDQSQAILKGTDDWINQRDLSDRYDYKKNRPFRDDPDFDPDDPDYLQRMKDEDADNFATGGRAGLYTGGMVDVEPNLSDIGHGSDALMARTRLVSPNSQATTSTGLNYLLAEDNDNIRVPFKDGLKVYPKIEANKRNINLGDGKNVDLQDLTYGGTLMYDKGPFSGGIEYLKGKDKFDFKDKDLTLDKDTTDREIANLILMMKLKDGSIKFKGNKDNQMINFSTSFADGGRIGFSGGGMGRRAFLKLMAALTGGIAAAKTGILGLSEGAGKKAVTETVKKSAGFNEVPPYFFKLVDKIRTMGDQTLASKDKAIAKKYKDYVMEEDFAGNIEIIKKNMDEMYPEEVYIKYTADDIATPNEKGFVKAAEYEEFTARPDMEGKMKDVEMGVPDEVVNEGSVFEDNMTEFGMTKKADGGRIGFSAGKNLAAYLADKTIKGSSTRFLEKVFGKQGLKEIIENDPDMHKGLLEVVEMFRAKDKQGLKTYMQKFLPHMDDETVEDFIIGSTESTEGIAGQLTRLGSGRDYKGKMEMMKQLEDVESLNKLDVTDRKPNASGGIATILGE